MIDKVFGFTEPPFSNTPDPRFFFPTETHRRALDDLRDGITGSKGFLLLTGDVGTGKTTLCRTLLKRLDNNIDTALVLNPDLSQEEILRVILKDFGLPAETASKSALMELLYEFLVERARMGRDTLIVIDDAQNLPRRSMEQVRMISNFETEKKKLVQILLVGQPELIEKLDQPDLRQVKQRIAVRTSLRCLNRQETADYILHRISVAGHEKKASLFTPHTLKAIYKWTGGYPRSVNTLCDRLLTTVDRDNLKVIDAGLVKQTMRLTGLGQSRRVMIVRHLKAYRWAAALACFGLFASVGTYFSLGYLSTATGEMPGSALKGRLAEVEKSLASLEKNMSYPQGAPHPAAGKTSPNSLERKLTEVRAESDSLRQKLALRERELRVLRRNKGVMGAGKKGTTYSSGSPTRSPSLQQKETKLENTIKKLQRESHAKEDDVRAIEKELDDIKRKLRETETEKEQLAFDLLQSRKLLAPADQDGEKGEIPDIVEQLREENEKLKRTQKLMESIAASTIKTQGNEIERLTKENEAFLKNPGNDEAAQPEGASGETTMVSYPSP